ncbi:MAG: T9SS type A sorting domain-containing protein [Bacteroidota bacterium]
MTIKRLFWLGLPLFLVLGPIRLSAQCDAISVEARNNQGQLINGSNVCDGEDISLSVTSSNCMPAVASVRWFDENGLFAGMGMNITVSASTGSPSIQTLSYFAVLRDASTDPIDSSELIDIAVNPLPNVTITPTPPAPVCAGTLVTLNALPSGGAGNYTYSWANPPGGSSSAPNVTPFTTTNYSVTVTDAIGCSNVDTENLLVNARPTATIFAPTTTTCPNVPITDLTACGNGGGNTYSWSPNTFLSNPNICNPTWTPTGQVSIEYTLTVTNPEGCTQSNTVTLNTQPEPNPTISSANRVCVGQNLSLEGLGGGNCSWSSNRGSVSPANNCNANFSANTPGPVTITLVMSIGACSRTVTKQIDVDPTPVINPVGASGCPNTPISLSCGSSGGNETYTWMPSTDLDDASSCTPIFTGAASRAYTVTVRSAEGCSSTGTVDATVFDPPTGGVQINTGAPTICSGGVLTLEATGGASYEWSTGAMTSVLTTAPVTEDTNFRVTVTDGNNCTDVATRRIEVVDQPTASIEGVSVICASEPFTLSAVKTGGIGNTTYSWKIGNDPFGSESANPDLPQSITGSTTYQVRVICDGYACDAAVSSEALVSVVPTPAPLIEGATSICRNQQVLYRVDNPTSQEDSRFEWSIPLEPVTTDIQIFGPYAFVHWSADNDGDTANVRVTEKIGDDNSNCEGNDELNVTISSATSRGPAPILYEAFNNLFIVNDPEATCYQWGFLDTVSGEFSEIPGETFQAFVAGNAFSESRIYWVKTWDGDCDNEQCASISFRAEEVESIFPPEEEKVFQVYPNPTTDGFQLVTNQLPEVEYELLVSDVLGRFYLQRTVVPTDGQVDEWLDLEGRAAGLYLVALVGSKGKISRQAKILLIR